jgi:hypothetical protein
MKGLLALFGGSYCETGHTSMQCGVQIHTASADTSVCCLALAILAQRSPVSAPTFPHLAALHYHMSHCQAHLFSLCVCCIGAWDLFHVSAEMSECLYYVVIINRLDPNTNTLNVNIESRV